MRKCKSANSNWHLVVSVVAFAVLFIFVFVFVLLLLLCYLSKLLVTTGNRFAAQCSVFCSNNFFRWDCVCVCVHVHVCVHVCVCMRVYSVVTLVTFASITDLFCLLRTHRRCEGHNYVVAHTVVHSRLTNRKLHDHYTASIEPALLICSKGNNFFFIFGNKSLNCPVLIRVSQLLCCSKQSAGILSFY